MGTEEPNDCLWTVGHSDRPPEELLALLQDAGIQLVADVRLAPWSRRHPWHSRAELERRLAAAGIEYLWLGAGLGGLRPEGYETHQNSEAYREALAELVAVARRRRTAVLCAEKEPGRCHRQFIAEDLVQKGFTVWHLIDPGQICPHQGPLPFNSIEQGEDPLP